MRIGILALQGAFLEHEQRLQQLGADCFEIRQLKDLEQGLDGLVLPGGESTVQRKLLQDLGLLQPLKEQIENGLPVLATCAGLILLAEEIDSGEAPCFGTIPMTAKRNAYGRQLGSFHTMAEVQGIGSVPMTFIRAPYIASVKEPVQVLSVVQGNIVAVQYGNQIALAFHPELDADPRLHAYFLDLVAQQFSS